MQAASRKTRGILLIGFLAYSAFVLAMPGLSMQAGILPSSLSPKVLTVLEATLAVFSVWGLLMPWLMKFGPASLRQPVTQAAKRQRWPIVGIRPEATFLLYGYIYLIAPTIGGLFLSYCGMPIRWFYGIVAASVLMELAWGLYSLRPAN